MDGCQLWRKDRFAVFLNKCKYVYIYTYIHYMGDIMRSSLASFGFALYMYKYVCIYIYIICNFLRPNVDPFLKYFKVLATGVEPWP